MRQASMAFAFESALAVAIFSSTSMGADSSRPTMVVAKVNGSTYRVPVPTGMKPVDTDDPRMKREIQALARRVILAGFVPARSVDDPLLEELLMVTAYDMRGPTLVEGLNLGVDRWLSVSPPLPRLPTVAKEKLQSRHCGGIQDAHLGAIIPSAERDVVRPDLPEAAAHIRVAPRTASAFSATPHWLLVGPPRVELGTNGLCENDSRRYIR